MWKKSRKYVVFYEKVYSLLWCSVYRLSSLEGLMNTSNSCSFANGEYRAAKYKTFLLTTSLSQERLASQLHPIRGWQVKCIIRLADAESLTTLWARLWNSLFLFIGFFVQFLFPPMLFVCMRVRKECVSLNLINETIYIASWGLSFDFWEDIFFACSCPSIVVQRKDCRTCRGPLVTDLCLLSIKINLCVWVLLCSYARLRIRYCTCVSCLFSWWSLMRFCPCIFADCWLFYLLLRYPPADCEFMRDESGEQNVRIVVGCWQ
jgi:hypothetical protein